MEEKREEAKDSSPRFPKPQKRPWRTAWRPEQPRTTKDAYLMLALMAVCWLICILMMIWSRLG